MSKRQLIGKKARFKSDLTWALLSACSPNQFVLISHKMAKTPLDLLDRHYEELERKWQVTSAESTYSELVTPTGNAGEPFHRWFHMKESFSHRLLSQIVADSGIRIPKEVSILDPFAGSGTTLLSGAELFADRRAVYCNGVERNPVLHCVASAKVLGRINGQSLVNQVSASGKRVLRQCSTESNRVDWDYPPSTTLSNRVYFSQECVDQLLSLSSAVQKVRNSDVRQILRACLVACVEKSGQLRRDGRALRYQSTKRIVRPFTAFADQLALIVEDLKTASFKNVYAQVESGDGRTSSARRKHDLVIFSPPYPNNIDYSEVYKVEGWVLGSYQSEADLRRQRASTIRSHPSIMFRRPYEYEGTLHEAEVINLLEPLLQAVPAHNRYTNERQRLIRGFADDMLTTLSSCRAQIRSQGMLAFVVGNSYHGSGDAGFVIAADLLMSRLAELAGFDVSVIRVARYPRRRLTNSAFLRESVVMLKPS